MARHPPRPRYRFCWWCSRQLMSNVHHQVVIVDGLECIVHKSCADEATRAELTAAPKGRP
jgi:hypothetical protein